MFMLKLIENCMIAVATTYPFPDGLRAVFQSRLALKRVGQLVTIREVEQPRLKMCVKQ